MATLSMRVNSEDKSLIEAYVKSKGLTFSNFARTTLLEYINEDLHIDEDRILTAKKVASVKDSIPVDEAFANLGV